MEMYEDPMWIADYRPPRERMAAHYPSQSPSLAAFALGTGDEEAADVAVEQEDFWGPGSIHVLRARLAHMSQESDAQMQDQRCLDLLDQDETDKEPRFDYSNPAVQHDPQLARSESTLRREDDSWSQELADVPQSTMQVVNELDLSAPSPRDVEEEAGVSWCGNKSLWASSPPTVMASRTSTSTRYQDRYCAASEDADKAWLHSAAQVAMSASRLTPERNFSAVTWSGRSANFGNGSDTPRDGIATSMGGVDMRSNSEAYARDASLFTRESPVADFAPYSYDVRSQGTRGNTNAHSQAERVMMRSKSSPFIPQDANPRLPSLSEEYDSPHRPYMHHFASNGDTGPRGVLHLSASLDPRANLHGASAGLKDDSWMLLRSPSFVSPGQVSPSAEELMGFSTLGLGRSALEREQRQSSMSGLWTTPIRPATIHSGNSIMTTGNVTRGSSVSLRPQYTSVSRSVLVQRAPVRMFPVETIRQECESFGPLREFRVLDADDEGADEEVSNSAWDSVEGDGGSSTRSGRWAAGDLFVSYFDMRHTVSAVRHLKHLDVRFCTLIEECQILTSSGNGDSGSFVSCEAQGGALSQSRECNQGTLVVFNVDPVVKTEVLRSLFMAYGEVKEIRDTTHRRNHKFIEFFDVRDAHRALCALNRTEFNGKKLKIEFSRACGSRGNSAAATSSGGGVSGGGSRSANHLQLSPSLGASEPHCPLTRSQASAAVAHHHQHLQPQQLQQQPGNGNSPMPGPLKRAQTAPSRKLSFSGFAQDLCPASSHTSSTHGYYTDRMIAQGTATPPASPEMSFFRSPLGMAIGERKLPGLQLQPSLSIESIDTMNIAMVSGGRQLQSSNQSAQSMTPERSGNGNGHSRGDISGPRESNSRFSLNIARVLEGKDTRTSLMVRNIPNKYTQRMLLATIEETHRGLFDFFYLPIDFKNRCNVGYAFINFVRPTDIVSFFERFHARKWGKFNSEKICEIAYARIQGKASLVAHFQNSSLMNEDPKCRPVLFNTAGEQEEFPVGSHVRTRRGPCAREGRDHTG
ncbi:Protein MEI2-like 4 [Porphyridium purpureum]|uniref:Protein MEI2-like 4 n=1 Tax=Porphyridium purpureum TaxID=35688 RepID=A0A5J4Z9X1_PORPP|nr:Protein MEI2-like 4 [Porphyridium purpureum]|eukprot:POR1050..scf295_1